VDLYGNRLRAIILTGSLARDEASFSQNAAGWSLLGDADFLVFFKEHYSLPARAEVERVQREIEGNLSRRGIDCEIGLSVAQPAYLRKLKPHIFAYELKRHAEVILGEPTILSLVPEFTPADIPREDAWRLLCNRAIEFLGVICEETEVATAPSSQARYRTIKLVLDMATSYLLFAGHYEPSYRERAKKLRLLAERSSEQEPFPMQDFAERVDFCTRLKLLGFRSDEEPPTQDQEDAGLCWQKAVLYAVQLWRWEMRLLTGCVEPISDNQLWTELMRREPLRARLQGWLSLAKRRGFIAGCQDWTRLISHGWRASPRYFVYALAYELFHRLPSIVDAGQTGLDRYSDWDELRRRLPVSRQSDIPYRAPAWRQLAAEIVWNYQAYLVGTRA